MILVVSSLDPGVGNCSVLWAGVCRIVAVVVGDSEGGVRDLLIRSRIVSGRRRSAIEFVLSGIVGPIVRSTDGVGSCSRGEMPGLFGSLDSLSPFDSVSAFVSLVTTPVVRSELRSRVCVAVTMPGSGD